MLSVMELGQSFQKSLCERGIGVPGGIVPGVEA
jgi:hypothetical protein